MSALELSLPLTDTGRKYGYIVWPKSMDAEVREFLGSADELTFVVPGGRQRRCRVDWKHHRASIGYSVTRGLRPEANRVLLSREGMGRFAISFVEAS